MCGRNWVCAVLDSHSLRVQMVGLAVGLTRVRMSRCSCVCLFQVCFEFVLEEIVHLQAWSSFATRHTQNPPKNAGCFEALALLSTLIMASLSQAVFQTWRRSHWANWMFEVDSIDQVTSTIKFGKGGFQGSRGGPGSDWYVDRTTSA